MTALKRRTQAFFRSGVSPTLSLDLEVSSGNTEETEEEDKYNVYYYKEECQEFIIRTYTFISDYISLFAGVGMRYNQMETGIEMLFFQKSSGDQYLIDYGLHYSGEECSLQPVSAIFSLCKK